VVLALLFVASCAKGGPRLTPDELAFVDLPAAEAGRVENEDEMDITIPAFNPLTAADPAEQIMMRFRGSHRKVPKTSIASGAKTTFDGLEDLLESLPDDDDMRDHTPAITTSTMSRATEENRNVKVTAWMYAIKYEADQDWHVILGTDPADGDPTFFNAEVSGLPGNAASSFAKLKKVRQSLATILDGKLPGGGSYRKYTKPIPVIVEGSLFFDIDHVAGVVGPTGMRPQTAWEIHPITSLRVQ
jgi:hypothetical protein